MRKGCAFYATLYQEMLFGNSGGGRILNLPINNFDSMARRSRLFSIWTSLYYIHDFIFCLCKYFGLSGVHSFSNDHLFIDITISIKGIQ